jgi:YfiH family protein
VFVDRVTVGRAHFAFTDRHGGVSPAPFDSLDFGSADGQSGDDLQANRELLATALGRPADRLVFAHQVHGNDVVVVSGRAADESMPEADALVTTTPGVVVAMRVADCVPLLMADPHAGVVAAVHAGRRGAVVGVAPAAVQVMCDLGADVGRIVARLGPSICGSCYEVPAQLRDEVAATIPAAASMTSWGTAAVDVPGAVVAQLREVGIEATRVPVCTRESDDQFSYRRAHPTGRTVGVAWLDAS